MRDEVSDQLLFVINVFAWIQQLIHHFRSESVAIRTPVTNASSAGEEQADVV